MTAANASISIDKLRNALAMATPGPWERDPPTSSLYIQPVNDTSLGLCELLPVDCGSIASGHYFGPQSEGNAALLASARDVAERLVIAHNVLDAVANFMRQDDLSSCPMGERMGNLALAWMRGALRMSVNAGLAAAKGDPNWNQLINPDGRSPGGA